MKKRDLMDNIGTMDMENERLWEEKKQLIALVRQLVEALEECKDYAEDFAALAKGLRHRKTCYSSLSRRDADTGAVEGAGG
jgi:hypothetical protein